MLKLWQNILHLGISPSLYYSRCRDQFQVSIPVSASLIPLYFPPSLRFPTFHIPLNAIVAASAPTPFIHPPPSSLLDTILKTDPESKLRQAPYCERGGGDWKIEASTLLHLNPVKHIMSITHLCLPRPPLIICQTLLGRRQPTDSRKLQSNDHWPSSSPASASLLYWSTGTGLLFVVVNILIFRYFIWLT